MFRHLGPLYKSFQEEEAEAEQLSGQERNWS